MDEHKACPACGQWETLVRVFDGREPYYLHLGNEWPHCEAPQEPGRAVTIPQVCGNSGPHQMHEWYDRDIWRRQCFGVARSPQQPEEQQHEHDDDEDVDQVHSGAP